MYPAENSSQKTDPLAPPRSLETEPLELNFRPLVLTKPKLEHLWARMSQFPQVFDDVIPRTFEAFKEGMLAPTNQFYEITQGDEILGLAAATQVRPRLDANMHLVMFDRRLRGREYIIRAAMKDFARRAALRRMTVSLPEDNKTAIKLVARLGFKVEGVMRKAHLRDGVYRDYHIFGILAEELFDSDSNAERPREAIGNGSPVRPELRGGGDELQDERLPGEDGGVHGEPAGDSPVPARGLRAEGSDSGRSV